MTRGRIRCFKRCTRRIGLRLELGFGSDVRVRVRLRFRVNVMHV